MSKYLRKPNKWGTDVSLGLHRRAYRARFFGKIGRRFVPRFGRRLAPLLEPLWHSARFTCLWAFRLPLRQIPSGKGGGGIERSLFKFVKSRCPGLQFFNNWRRSGTLPDSRMPRIPKSHNPKWCPAQNRLKNLLGVVPSREGGFYIVIAGEYPPPKMPSPKGGATFGPTF